uniref:Autophagy-related protein 101 n=1 Tax=Romanomermis culicivorax TaxID=13658 RepID=A0A915INF4_ROMCU
MNAYSQKYELTLEGPQIEEAVAKSTLSIYVPTHDIANRIGSDSLDTANRILHYASDNEFYIGTLGTEDVDCDFIDLTYVRVNEDQIKRDVHNKIYNFKESLRQREGEKHGEIILQFFEKERGRLLDCVKPWELWILKLTVVRLNSESEHQMYRESVGEALSDIIFSICREINRPRYTPKMPKRQELPQVFDNSYSSFHPYLHKIVYDAANPSYGIGLSSAVSSTVSTVQGLLKMSLNK